MSAYKNANVTLQNVTDNMASIGFIHWVAILNSRGLPMFSSVG